MLGRSSGYHDWLLATQALAFLAAFVYVTHATQAIAFGWKPGLSDVSPLYHHHHSSSSNNQLMSACVVMPH